MAQSEDVQRWLRSNGYDDIADQIDTLMQRWAKEGNSTRRNWWDILAGNLDGRPRKVAGIEFPVLRAAQLRQGRSVTKNAIARSRKEVVPEVWATGRWPKT